MSGEDSVPSGLPTDGESLVGPRPTRRTLLQASGGSLLGALTVGNASAVTALGPGDGTDPTPGDVDWNAYIEDPGVVGEHNEPPHVPTTKPYASLNAALAAERERDFLTDQWLESEYVTALDGAWQFDFATDLDGAATDTDDYEDWDTVYVPHTWNTDGYGDLGFYNVAVGFSPNDPPKVPSKDNSVGTYKREFSVPDGWTRGRQTYLTIGGAKAGYFVWINDTYVGYKQGSMTPGEFNVTDVVETDSTNTVTIQVVRWTDGTYLEQQHMWRFAGIFRDALLYSKPNLHVRDLHAVTDLDSSYTDGTLELNASVANHWDDEPPYGRGPPGEDDDHPGRGPPEDRGEFGRPPREATLRASLYDPSGTELDVVERDVAVTPGDVVSLDDDTITDASDSGNDGRIAGDPTFVDGPDGSALEFDGTNDWIDTRRDGSLDVTDAVTLEAVVHGEGLSGHQPIVAKGDTAYALKMSDGDLQFFVYDGSWNTVTAAPPDGWTGSWHRVTGVFDGSALRLYVDGTEIASSSFSGTIATNRYSLGVGHNTEATGRYFGGTLDSVRVYDRALSPAEVAADRTEPDESTRLWYDFEDNGDPIEMTVPDVEAWTAETPSLYTLGIEVIPSGPPFPTEAMVEKVGFRTYEVVETSDGTAEKVALNGEAITMAGTNRHEYSLDHGRHVPTERMRKEIEIAKRNNANAIRCSHYPTRPDFYRLCDEYGLYVQDEVNTETHANQTLVNDHPEFDPSFLDRFRRMVVRDKNFPSINVWSTGNEAGLGPAHDEMAGFARVVDGTRLLGHQDNAGGYGSGFGGTASFADLNGIRYPYPGTIESMAKDDGITKPVVMGEFQIMSGNGGGLLTDFYDVIYEHEQLQGGYIWMWNQHQLNATEPPLDDALLDQHHRRAAIDDRSIAGQTALVNGSPTEVEGESGSALELDGETDWVDANHDDRIDITDDLTVEAVVRGDVPSDTAPIVAKGDSQYALRFDDGDLEFAVYDGDEWHAARASPPRDWSGHWHTVTGRYDGRAVELFVDGDRLAAEWFRGELESNRYRVGIGHNTEATDRFAAITVDSVRIFDRPIEREEVASLSAPDDSCRLWLDFELKEHHWGDGPKPTATIIDHRYVMPQLDVMKKAQQFLRFAAEDLTAGRVEITNVHDFTNASEFDFEWTLTEDDTVIARGSADPAIAPGETGTVELGYDEPPLQAGSEYFLDISATLATDAAWADAGHEVAFEQFKVPWDVPADPAVGLEDLDPVSVARNGSTVTVTGTDFAYEFDEDAGRFTSFQRHGEELLNRGPQLNAWREPVHNEVNTWGTAEVEDWRAAGLDEMTASVESVSVSQPADGAVLIEVETVDAAPDNDAEFRTTYRYYVLGSGDVVTRVSVRPNVEMLVSVGSYLPRIGLQCRLPSSFDGVEWFGRGPGETYPDRKWNERISRYSGSVADQFVQYVPPGDYGNKCDTRYAALTNDDGVGLLVHDTRGTDTMNVSVQEFTDMNDADRLSDLEYADGVVFNVDYAVSGVGGMPRNTLPEYSVEPTGKEFVYVFRPFDADTEDPMALSKRRLPFTDPSDGGETGPVGEGTYWLENVDSGKAMDVTSGNIGQNGANVIQWGYWGSDNQQWAAIRNDDGTYRLINLASRKVLAVESASTQPGAGLVQWDWNGGDEQRWSVTELADGRYRLENVNSGLVVGVDGGSTDDGADLVQTEWTGSDHQKWAFNDI